MQRLVGITRFSQIIAERHTQNVSSGSTTAQESTGRPVRNVPPPINRRQGSTGAVCFRYLQKKCPHGKSGRINGVCPQQHPRLCFKYLNVGDGRRGCDRGNECKYYHPRLCWNFSRKGSCQRQNCTYYHVKKQTDTRLRRTALQGDSQEPSSQVQRESHEPRNRVQNRISYGDAARGRRHPQRRNPAHYRSQERYTDSHINQREINSDNNFLLLQSQLREQYEQGSW